MKPEQEIRIKRLKSNLLAIRKFAGWTTQELGDLIGVSKQTISNLERKEDYQMTLTQYLAIRAVLGAEIEAHPENELLKTAVAVLVDDENLSEEEQEMLEENMTVVATAMAGGLDRNRAYDLARSLMLPLAGGALAGILTKNPFFGITQMVHLAEGIGLTGKDKNDEDLE